MRGKCYGRVGGLADKELGKYLGEGLAGVDFAHVDQVPSKFMGVFLLLL